LHYYHIWESRLLSSSRKSSFVCLLLFLPPFSPHPVTLSTYYYMYNQSGTAIRDHDHMPMSHDSFGFLHLHFCSFCYTMLSRNDNSLNVEDLWSRAGLIVHIIICRQSNGMWGEWR
jgi:hypothetical protein